jgi:Flp pilus assembly pilin Flp
MKGHSSMHAFLAMVTRDDRGQGLVEYALIVFLVGVAAIAAMTLLGSKANNSLNNSAQRLS